MHPRYLRFARALALSTGVAACAGSSANTRANEQTRVAPRDPSVPVSAAQCANAAPEGARCTVVGEGCGGGAGRCTEGNGGVPQRCGGEQWNCQCTETAPGAPPRWLCQHQYHNAGPYPPPDLPGASA